MALDWPRLRDAAFRERRRRGWKQKDLVERSGLSISTIRRFEEGKHVQDLASVQAICGALGLALTKFDDAVNHPVTRGMQTAPLMLLEELMPKDARGRLAYFALSMSPEIAAAIEGEIRELYNRRMLSDGLPAKQAEGP